MENLSLITNNSSLNEDSSLISHNLSLKSKEYRRKILKYIFHAKAGHTGGDLSIIDILNVLYNRIMNVSPENWESNDRDRFIQSKGTLCGSTLCSFGR
jgi:transketolase